MEPQSGALLILARKVEGSVRPVLDWRSALVLATAIPVGVAMTFVGMQVLGIPLHQISIAALIIALGLLVDVPVVASDGINRELAMIEVRMNEAIDAAKQKNRFCLGDDDADTFALYQRGDVDVLGEKCSISLASPPQTDAERRCGLSRSEVEAEDKRALAGDVRIDVGLCGAIPGKGRQLDLCLREVPDQLRVQVIRPLRPFAGAHLEAQLVDEGGPEYERTSDQPAVDRRKYDGHLSLGRVDTVVVAS